MQLQKNPVIDAGTPEQDSSRKPQKLRLVKETLKNLTVRTALRAGCMKEDCPGTCH